MLYNVYVIGKHDEWLALSTESKDKAIERARFEDMTNKRDGGKDLSVEIRFNEDDETGSCEVLEF